VNALFAVDWDTIFGYAVHDYCFVSVLCVVALSTLAFAMKVRKQSTSRYDR